MREQYECVVEHLVSYRTTLDNQDPYDDGMLPPKERSPQEQAQYDKHLANLLEKMGLPFPDPSVEDGAG